MAPAERCVSPSRFSGDFYEQNVHLGAVSVSASEFAASMWSVAQLFVRNRSASKIFSAMPANRGLLREVAASGVRSVELLPISLRFKLEQLVSTLYEDWPHGLLDFMNECGLSAEHLSVDRQVLPAWFEKSVRSVMRKQVRNISAVDVSRAVDEVRRSGESVTRESIGRVLGGCGSLIVKEATQ